MTQQIYSETRNAAYGVISLGNDNEYCYVVTKVYATGYYYSNELILLIFAVSELPKKKADIEVFSAIVEDRTMSAISSPYIVEGYDKDADRYFVMGGYPSSDAAIAAAKGYRVFDRKRTDGNREERRTTFGPVPDIDWFNVVRQDGETIQEIKVGI